MSKMFTKQNKGFTLVETIVAATIIAIVGVILVTGMMTVLNLWDKDTENRNDSANTEAQIAAGADATVTDVTTIHIGGYSLPTDILTYNEGGESHAIVGKGMYIPDGMELDGNSGGAEGSYIVSQDGYYKLEVWGAAGGANTRGDGTLPGGVGGKGGYSVGIVHLTKNDILYLIAGGKGNNYTGGDGSTLLPGGKNGGGFVKQHGGSGGGASDIRINNKNDLYYRVIVAGGGGGGGYRQAQIGGAGGGTDGLQGITTSGGAAGSGGRQTVGGAGPQSTAGSQQSPLANGSFGVAFSTPSTNGAGGGGGWYGGGKGAQASDDGAGGGGSGWVYTSDTFATWQSGNSTDANQYKLTDKYYLTDAQTFNGEQSMPDPNNDAPMTGNSDNGYVRISWVGFDD